MSSAIEASRLKVGLALATLYVVWSSTYLALRFVVAELPALTSSGVRFVLAGLVLLLAIRIKAHRWPTLRTLAIAAPLGVLVFAVGNGFVAMAQRTVSSGTAAVACAAIPCFASAVEALAGKPVHRREMLGIGLGLAGVVVLESGALAGGLGSAAWLLVLAPMGWALGSVLARRWLARDPFGAAAGQMLGGGVAALAMGGVLGETMPTAVSAQAGLSWLYLVVVGSLIAFSAYAWLLHNTSIGVATSYAFVNPVAALVLGTLVGGETLSPATLPAIGLVLAGLVLVLGARARAVPVAVAASSAVAHDPVLTPIPAPVGR
jgi:drug/metabolite transporter (DMT)-like permease